MHEAADAGKLLILIVESLLKFSVFVRLFGRLFVRCRVCFVFIAFNAVVNVGDASGAAN